MWSRAVMVFALTLLLVDGGLGAAADPPPAPERRTPRDWDQWQPKIDDSDSRLDRPISIREPEIELEALLARLSQTTGVSLSASGDLAPQRLTVFAQGHPLNGLMLGLSGLYEGYWVFRRGQRPGARTYVLVEYQSATAFLDRSLTTWFHRVTGQTESERGQSLLRRLRLYRQALALSSGEVLSRFEASDPWLCAEVLRPETRPLLTAICGVSEARLCALIQESTVMLPASEVGAPAHQLLRQWQAAHDDHWDRQQSTSDEDCAALFGAAKPDSSASEEGLARLRWNGFTLELQVLTPRRTYSVTLLSMPDGPLGGARRALLALGYGEATPERLQAIAAEEDVWQNAHNDDWDGDDLFELSAAPEGNTSDPRLSTKVRPEVAPGDAVEVSFLLGKVAEQCGLLVVADGLTQERSRCRLEGGRWCGDGQGGEIELFQILDALRCQNGVIWKLHGSRLAATRDEPRLTYAGEPADLRTWAANRYPVIFALLDDTAGALALLAQ